MIPTRWAPTSSKWGYSITPYKYDEITTGNPFIRLSITSGGPLGSGNPLFITPSNRVDERITHQFTFTLSKVLPEMNFDIPLTDSHGTIVKFTKSLRIQIYDIS